MKKIIFISIAMSLVATTTMAQNIINNPQEFTPEKYTNYYPDTSGTITRSGYTYKYRNEKFKDIELGSRIELYNAANQYLDVEWGYKDGTPMSGIKLLGMDDTPDFTDSSQTIAQTLSMVDGYFTTQQKNILRGNSMMIKVRFNPATGIIVDVDFRFFRDSPFVNIPVETYRGIELALKQNLTITVTNEGRRLNYISLFWSQKF